VGHTISLWAKQANIIRRSTVLIIPHQLVFPAMGFFCGTKSLSGQNRLI
jgi:hypothetical protein